MSRSMNQNIHNMGRKDMGMSSVDISKTTKETLDSVVSTVNNNKLLIGSVAAGCGVAIFLLTTDSGKRVLDKIQDRAVDLFDFVSDQVSGGLSQVRNMAQDILSRTSEQAAEGATGVRDVA